MKRGFKAPKYFPFGHIFLKIKELARSDPDTRCTRKLGLSAWRLSREISPAISNCSDKCTVGPCAEDAHRRITRAYRSKEDIEDQEHCKHDIGPRIQRPLAGPLDRPVLGERGKVWKRPEVIGARPAGADDIAQKVQVHRDKAEKEHTQSIGRKYGQNQGDRDRGKDVVEQRVVVLAVIPRAGSAQQPVDSIRQDAETVRVGQDTTPGCKG
jgi:hypothetical protein